MVKLRKKVNVSIGHLYRDVVECPNIETVNQYDITILCVDNIIKKIDQYGNKNTYVRYYFLNDTENHIEDFLEYAESFWEYCYDTSTDKSRENL